MVYVDLERRRTEKARLREERDGFWEAAWRNPYLSLAAGFGIGVPAFWVSVFLAYVLGGAHPGLLLLPLAPTVVLACRGIWQFQDRRPASVGSGPNGERDLLLAIRDAGGGITPVEAAIRISLTVEEADRMLTRLADGGHLLVRSYDGALFYALPDGRPGRG